VGFSFKVSNSILRKLLFLPCILHVTPISVAVILHSTYIPGAGLKADELFKDKYDCWENFLYRPINNITNVQFVHIFHTLSWKLGILNAISCSKQVLCRCYGIIKTQKELQRFAIKCIHFHLTAITTMLIKSRQMRLAACSRHRRWEMRTQVWSGNLKVKILLGKPMLIWETIIKTYVRKYDILVWTRFIWLRMRWNRVSAEIKRGA
jgi:hypothetical protein